MPPSRKSKGWEEALQEVEIPGARAILRDLGALKRQLDQDEPDGDRIRTILSRLADATMKISDKVEDRNADKVRDLGQALETASEEEEEEEMDRNQEFAPIKFATSEQCSIFIATISR